MLQIGIDQHRGSAVPPGMVEARQHRRLLAEIAGELQQGDRNRLAKLLLMLLKRTDLINGAVPGAVINQHQPVDPGHRQHPFNEMRDHGLLVETGSHNPNPCRFHHGSPEADQREL